MFSIAFLNGFDESILIGFAVVHGWSSTSTLNIKKSVRESMRATKNWR